MTPTERQRLSRERKAAGLRVHRVLAPIDFPVQERVDKLLAALRALKKGEVLLYVPCDETKVKAAKPLLASLRKTAACDPPE